MPIPATALCPEVPVTDPPRPALGVDLRVTATVPRSPNQPNAAAAADLPPCIGTALATSTKKYAIDTQTSHTTSRLLTPPVRAGPPRRTPRTSPPVRRPRPIRPHPTTSPPSPVSATVSKSRCAASRVQADGHRNSRWMAV